MYKIGMIDYFLDEWHAQNYPKWVDEISKGEFKIAYAYGDSEDPAGLVRSNQAFCEELGIELLSDISDVIQKSDALIVLSPDNPEHHLRLSKEALQSGKPVYVDKTFSNSLAEAKQMFEWADENNTPMYSSSALRYAKAYQAIDGAKIIHMTTTGPGTPYNYLVHQLEPIFMLLKTRAKRVMAWGQSLSQTYLLEMSNRVHVTMLQNETHDFTMTLETKGSIDKLSIDDNFFYPFMEVMLEFFKDHLEGRQSIPVDREDTLAIMEAREKLLEALETPGTWINISET